MGRAEHPFRFLQHRIDGQGRATQAGQRPPNRQRQAPPAGRPSVGRDFHELHQFVGNLPVSGIIQNGRKLEVFRNSGKIKP